MSSSVTELVVLPLGGGQEVGKSCILLQYCDRNIILDSGIHPGERCNITTSHQCISSPLCLTFNCFGLLRIWPDFMSRHLIIQCTRSYHIILYHNLTFRQKGIWCTASIRFTTLRTIGNRSRLNHTLPYRPLCITTLSYGENRWVQCTCIHDTCH